MRSMTVRWSKILWERSICSYAQFEDIWLDIFCWQRFVALKVVLGLCLHKLPAYWDGFDRCLPTFCQMQVSMHSRLQKTLRIPQVVGYIVYTTTQLKVHISKVSVDKGFRRQGIAKKLIQAIFIPTLSNLCQLWRPRPRLSFSEADKPSHVKPTKWKLALKASAKVLQCVQESLERAIKARGVMCSTLHVDPANEAARLLYLGLGFTCDRVLEGYYGASRPCWMMMKEL